MSVRIYNDGRSWEADDTNDVFATPFSKFTRLRCVIGRSITLQVNM